MDDLARVRPGRPIHYSENHNLWSGLGETFPKAVFATLQLSHIRGFPVNHKTETDLRDYFLSSPKDGKEPMPF